MNDCFGDNTGWAAEGSGATSGLLFIARDFGRPSHH
jgi:hypothetical protein